MTGMRLYTFGNVLGPHCVAVYCCSSCEVHVDLVKSDAQLHLAGLSKD